MNVLGLDLSLTCTGWALLDYDTGDLVGRGTIGTTATDSTLLRIDHVRRELFYVHETGEGLADVAIEEGIAYHSGTTTRHLAGLRWTVAVDIWRRTGIEAAPVNLSAIKRLATGNGNAPKAAVTRAAVERWGERVDQPDIADAAWCAEWLRRERIRHYEKAGS